jgi:hypothetical protein
MKTNQKPTTVVPWYDQRRWALLMALVGLVLTYLVASLAVEDGNLGTYFMAFVFLVLTVNRATKAIKGGRKNG